MAFEDDGNGSDHNVFAALVDLDAWQGRGHDANSHRIVVDATYDAGRAHLTLSTAGLLPLVRTEGVRSASLRVSSTGSPQVAPGWDDAPTAVFLVLSFGFFDHDAAVREYPLPDGRMRPNILTSPQTIQISELFQIRDGKIDRIEAVIGSVPYGMKSDVWDE